MLALTTEKRLLEYRVINAHRTLAHGLGRALIEARTLKGLLAFPGRVRRLSMKQKVKRRERVPNSFTVNVAALLRLVDPAFGKAATEGVDAAADWVKAQKAEPAARARALAELAHWSLAADPIKAGRIGAEAARIYPGDQRLFALAVRLREQGLVLVPASLCAAIREHQPLSQPQARLCDLMAEDASLLEHGRWGDGLKSGLDHIPGEVSRDDVVIICPARWVAMPRVLAAKRQAISAGLSVSIMTPADPPRFQGFTAAHIFADSIAMACSLASDARASGCRVIIDLSNPSPSMLSPKGSELATVDIVRLKGLAANSEALIARSMSLSVHLKALDINHIVAGDEGSVADSPAEGAIAAALKEYGAEPEQRTIGCFATLDGDAALPLTLSVFSELVGTGDAEQLLVFGKGSESARLATRANELGIPNRVVFVGLPPPQRWRALIAALDLALFPRIAEETLGSEIPMLFVQSVLQGRKLLASEAAWNAQATFDLEPTAMLAEPGDQLVQIRDTLQGENAIIQPVSIDDSLGRLYKAFARPSQA